MLAEGQSHAHSGNTMAHGVGGGGSRKDPQAGAWVEESGFCSFTERAVLVFLNVLLWARAGENASESKEKQFTHTQSGCEFTTLSIPKVTTTSAAKRTAVLAWFEGQPPSAQATRTHASVAIQFCKSKRPDCSAGVEEIKQKKKKKISGVYKSKGVSSVLRSPAHPERAAWGSVGIEGHWQCAP